MRIDARLGEEAENNLHYLQEVTQPNNTEIVKAALRHYAKLLRKDARCRNAALSDSGFNGCFDGHEELSVNYKQCVQAHLDEKYPAE
jgi:hypothetical protein